MTSIVNHHVAKSSAFTRVMPIRGSGSTVGNERGGECGGPGKGRLTNGAAIILYF